VDVFSYGGIFQVNGMNIAEVKKNAMIILSTNPGQMFISGQDTATLNR